MAPFTTSYTTFYPFTIVIIALSCTGFELFDVEDYDDFGIYVRGHSRSLAKAPFDRSHRAYDFLLAFHSVYGPILHRFGDKARYWSKKTILYTLST